MKKLPLFFTLMFAASFNHCKCNGKSSKTNEHLSRVISRGSHAESTIFLIFKCTYFEDEAKQIFAELAKRKIKANLFFYGTCVSRYPWMVKQALAEKHYVGPASNKHPYYVAKDNPNHTIISKEDFISDMKQNLSGLEALGAKAESMRYMMVPHGLFNLEIVEWARELGLTIVTPTPGTLTRYDWVPSEKEKLFHSSAEIIESVTAHLKKGEGSLNGFILPFYISTHPTRIDKVPPRLPKLLDELIANGYSFRRIEEMKDVN